MADAADDRLLALTIDLPPDLCWVATACLLAAAQAGPDREPAIIDPEATAKP